MFNLLDQVVGEKVIIKVHSLGNIVKSSEREGWFDAVSDDPQIWLEDWQEFRGKRVKINFYLTVAEKTTLINPKLYLDLGGGCCEAKAFRFQVAGEGIFQLSIDFPDALERLRLDPLDLKGTFFLGEIEIKESDPALLSIGCMGNITQSKVGDSCFMATNGDPQVWLDGWQRYRGMRVKIRCLLKSLEVGCPIAPKLYVDSGTGFSEAKSYRLERSEDGLYEVAIDIASDMECLRLDPLSSPGPFRMDKLQIFVCGGEIVKLDRPDNILSLKHNYRSQKAKATMDTIGGVDVYAWLDEDYSKSNDATYKVPLGVQFLLEYGRRKISNGLEVEAELIHSYFYWCSKLSDFYPDMRWDLPPEKILDFLNNYDLLVVCETVCQSLARTSTSIICAVLVSSRADDILRWLSKPSRACADIIPLGLYHIWLSRPDLVRSFDLKLKEGCEKFITWWCKFGCNEYEFLQYSPDLNDGLKLAPLNRVIDHILRRSTLSELELTKKLLCLESEGTELLPFQQLIAKDRPDLMLTKTGRGLGLKDALEAWWENSGAYELKSLYSIVTKEKTLSPSASEGGSVSAELKSAGRPGEGEKEGVNIIGYPFGMLGLGEDARQMGLCLKSAGIESALIEAPIRGPKRRVEVDASFRVIDKPQYRMSVFCLPPTDMIRLGLEGGREFVASSEYRIGAWPWELPEWPERYCKIINVVDEVWAQSEYVANCFRRLGHPNVVKMPMGVTLPNSPDRQRERWGLNSEDFVFYVTFDGNSFITRKNPVAAVNAFLKAFPAEICGDLNVRLLIKAINVKDDVYWNEILTLAVRDSRIVVFTESLNREDMVNLMASADCYISLHRSEGFGRGIAEAMLLGQPVVVSAFSGNTDFCNDDTAFCVAGRVVPVPSGHYLFDDGQYWYDPDLDDAAEKMRLLYNDPELRRLKADRGKEFIERAYSKEAVASAYKERVEAIFSHIP